MTCVICGRTLRETETASCRRCVEKLDEDLADILEHYALLPLILAPGSVVVDGTPHGTQPFPSPPVRLDVVAMTDPRSRWQQEPWDIPDILGTLGSW